MRRDAQRRNRRKGEGLLGRIDVLPLGDAALLYVWPEGTRPSDIAARVERIRKERVPGVMEWVPAYRTAAVHLDLEELSRAGAGLEGAIIDLAERLLAALERPAQAPDGESARRIRLPAVFGGAFGPDLEACAERTGMSVERFVQMFTSTEFEVAMLGFAPGFPYLSGLPGALFQPRRESPRLSVPAGSVGIAGNQAGVYPVRSPGGWQIIARTPARLFRPEAEQPFLLAPGDRVSFEPVTADHPDVAALADEAAPTGPEHTPGTQDAALTVAAPGMQSTVQDAGRFGWRTHGVSAGGAMDFVSLRLANALVGNPEGAAALEITMLGPSFRLRRDLLIAVCGAEFDVRVDGEPIPLSRPVWVRSGAELRLGRASRGCRGYLAVAGGIEVPPVLGSRSTDLRSAFGGYGGRALAAGDELRCGRPAPAAERLSRRLREQADLGGRAWAAVLWGADLPYPRAKSGAGSRIPLRVVWGAEWDAFDRLSRSRFQTEAYRVEAASDRMGVRLSGAAVIRERAEELPSHGVVPGTIQVPPDGRPIILGADCQPTGGYPKIAHVIRADMPVLAQCAPGDVVEFVPVSHEEAWSAWQAMERGLRIRLAGIRLKGADA
jgi:KipI family sensor histidine kinase inhibitor